MSFKSGFVSSERVAV